jgi:hypothetical protein
MLKWLLICLGNALLWASIIIVAAGIWAYGEHAGAVVYSMAGVIVLVGYIARSVLADTSNEN